MTPTHGSVLAGRYRLDDLLADHDSARFWRATDTVLARNVAVHAVASDDPRAPALLEAARLSATVTDPHLLRVLDCDDSDGTTWVVNEWGEGVSLDLMLEQGTLPPSRAAWLTREVAEAIAAGHAAGVAHGRLNPEAVLVTHAGAVKLIGYVIDASLEPAGAPDPMYGELDDREADVIDLAGILYAALTGRWPGVAHSAVPRAPREGRRPLRPRQVRAGVPRTLDTICERVLNQEASQHAMPIETAHEIAAALADYTGEPGPAPNVEPGALHVEPTVSIPRGDLSAPPPAAEDLVAEAPVTEAPVTEAPVAESPAPATSSTDPALPGEDNAGDDLEQTQLSAAVSDERRPVPPPPPPFEDAPERPLFADSARRVPAGAQPGATPGGSPANPSGDGGGDAVGGGVGRHTGSPAGAYAGSHTGSYTGAHTAGRGASAAETTAGGGRRGPGGDDLAEFWPFVEAPEEQDRGRTGREGRGWLRVAIVAVVLIVLAAAAVYWLESGESPTATRGDSTASASPSATGSPLTIARVLDFDPDGDGAENSDTVGRAVDDDPSTGWQTVTYYNNAALGGLKPGVGLMLDLGRESDPASVSIRFGGAPTDVAVYAASPGVTEAPGALDQMDEVGTRSGAPERTTITLRTDTRTRYLLVWLTKLPQVSGGFRGEITDVSVSS